METLIRPQALAGTRLGISVSESEDLARLGLLEMHFRMTLAEITRAVLVGRGQLAYGGNLKPEGYTAFVAREVERYAGRDAPFKAYLAWSEHRKLKLSELTAASDALGLWGELICLDEQGNRLADPAAGRGEEVPSPPLTEEQTRASLTALRRCIVRETHARVLLGGKRRGFQGAMPGVLEEAILTVEAGQALYLVGGFGGAATDIARALGIGDENWLPPFEQAPPPDERLTRGIAALVAAADRTGRRSLSNNGLTAEENRQLTMTHRPGEVGALIARGLAGIAGRR
jgi:hypothetical protein